MRTFLLRNVRLAIASPNHYFVMKELKKKMKKKPPNKIANSQTVNCENGQKEKQTIQKH